MPHYNTDHTKEDTADRLIGRTKGMKSHRGTEAERWWNVHQGWQFGLKPIEDLNCHRISIEQKIITSIMGCENSTMVIPINDPHTPPHASSHNHTPTPIHKATAQPQPARPPSQATKENLKPKEPSFKGHKEIFITSETQGKAEMKRKSKSESKTMEMALAEVLNAGREGEEKKKSICQPPKNKSISVDSPTEQQIQQELGPSSHSITLPDPPTPPAEESFKQIKVPPSRWVNHMEEHVNSQALVGSIASEKVSIEPFKFEIFAEEHHTLPKTDRERLEEEIRQERAEVAHFMEQLAVRDEDLLQLVIQKIEEKEELAHDRSESRKETRKEAKKEREFTGDGEWEMERMMQEELRQEELRMEKQLMKSMGVGSTPTGRSPSQSFAP